MTTTPSAERPRGGRWRHRDFRTSWTSETTSQLGTAVTVVALPLVAVDSLHASTFVVTVLTASTWMPWLLLGLAAGALSEGVSVAAAAEYLGDTPGVVLGTYAHLMPADHDRARAAAEAAFRSSPLTALRTG